MQQKSKATNVIANAIITIEHIQRSTDKQRICDTENSLVLWLISKCISSDRAEFISHVDLIDFSSNLSSPAKSESFELHVADRLSQQMVPAHSSRRHESPSPDEFSSLHIGELHAVLTSSGGFVDEEERTC